MISLTLMSLWMIIVGFLFGAKPLLEPRLMSTLLTPNVVLPLFATRFTGGIWVSFIKAHLINWWPSLEIYDKHLLGWNLWICFPCICSLGCPGIFMENIMQFKHRIMLFVCGRISKMPTNSSWNEGSPWSWGGAPSYRLLGCEFKWDPIQDRSVFHAFISLSLGTPAQFNTIRYKRSLKHSISFFPVEICRNVDIYDVFRAVATRENTSGFYHTEPLKKLQWNVNQNIIIHIV